MLYALRALRDSCTTSTCHRSLSITRERERNIGKRYAVQAHLFQWRVKPREQEGGDSRDLSYQVVLHRYHALRKVQRREVTVPSVTLER